MSQFIINVNYFYIYQSPYLNATKELLINCYFTQLLEIERCLNIYNNFDMKQGVLYAKGLLCFSCNFETLKTIKFNSFAKYFKNIGRDTL